VVQQLQNVLFPENMALLANAHNVVFVDALERNFLAVDAVAPVNFSERTSAELHLDCVTFDHLLRPVKSAFLR